MGHFTEFTQEDVNQTAPLPVDWYIVQINSFDKTLSKKGDSDNYVLTGVVISNAAGDTTFAGRKSPGWWGFNSKLLGLSKGLWESLGVTVKPGTKVDWEALIGKKVCIFIAQDMYNGQVTNQMTNKYQKIA